MDMPLSMVHDIVTAAKIVQTQAMTTMLATNAVTQGLEVKVAANNSFVAANAIFDMFSYLESVLSFQDTPVGGTVDATVDTMREFLRIRKERD